MAYKRVLLKLSGEVFGDDNGKGIDLDKVATVANYIHHLREVHKTDLAIVVGGGNLFRGRNVFDTNFNQALADCIGMLGTIMNALALQGKLNELGIKNNVMSSIETKDVCEPYIRLKALDHIEKGHIVILAGGLGIPLITTDTAAANMAAQLECDILLKGSTVDGVYSADPKTDSNAVKYSSLSFQEALEKRLMVMDSTAFAHCKTQNIPVIVFDISDLENIERILNGESIGTLIS
jgi:uridylate kinase